MIRHIVLKGHGHWRFALGLLKEVDSLSESLSTFFRDIKKMSIDCKSNLTFRFGHNYIEAWRELTARHYCVWSGRGDLVNVRPYMPNRYPHSSPPSSLSSEYRPSLVDVWSMYVYICPIDRSVNKANIWQNLETHLLSFFIEPLY